MSFLTTTRISRGQASFPRRDRLLKSASNGATVLTAVIAVLAVAVTAVMLVMD